MGTFHSAESLSTRIDEFPVHVNITTEETDEQVEAGLEERRRILEDCNMLKQYATFHLHPERPVTEDPTVRGRCYFDRPSAPQQESVEDMMERVRVLEECSAIRTYADFFLHPERPIKTTDSTAFGRNYFSRPSAIPPMSKEDADEKAQALEEAQLFKQFAAFHLHPERGVITTDPTSFGRNYFDRASAIPQESHEEMKERNAVLSDVEMLKTTARFHVHPELPVKSADPLACGRNFFDRPSGVERETLEEMDERSAVMKEVAALKMHAEFHLHPELSVRTTDPVACARCYFDRFSAPEGETKEEMEERDQIFLELGTLKMYANFHLHPELPVETRDPCVRARNYFDRASAPDIEAREQIREKEEILRDAAQLEGLVQVLHTGHTLEQDYFRDCHVVHDGLMSEIESSENLEERHRILEDAARLEMYAKFHLHPELPVQATDPFARERNFFNRISAPEQESPEDAEERYQVLKDAKCLEECAQMLHNGCTLEHDYFHGHFIMDEDMIHDEFEVAVLSDQEGGTVETKLQEEGRLSRSPSSIFGFA